MLQFVIRADELSSVIARKFPFKIGRDPSADLCILAPGVWQKHAELSVDSASQKIAITRAGEGLILINGEPADRKVLVPGDEIQVGGAILTVTLSAVEQRPLVGSEAMVWLLLIALSVLEVALIVAAK